MATPTALLITRDASLVGPVQEAIGSVAHLGLRTVADVEDVYSLVRGPEVALLLLHIPRSAGPAPAQQLLKYVAGLRRQTAVVILSDQNEPEQALTLLRLGAADYLDRPLDLRRLAYRADVLTLRARHGSPGAAPAPEPAPAPLDPGPLGPLMEQVARVAPQETTLLLTGETGTGKTRLARLVHDLSPRRGEPLVEVNCASLTPTLIESELFGHVKGAFTGADRDRSGKFAEAGRGTLLLDEVDSLPPALQAKLLRAVEDRVFEPVGTNKSLPVRARLIAATNRVLDEEVSAGRFRADLYYRLNVVGFYLPPLRERIRMVESLAPQFLTEFALRNMRQVHGISAEALRALLEHRWPGNVRELRNVIERAVALCPGPQIQLADLPEAVRGPSPAPRLAPAPEAAREVVVPLAQTKGEAEAVRIAEALRRNRNNRQRAAAELGISRMTLYTKLHRYGLMGAQ
jgi:DNA-binding NtrC family response regulator